jgi:hypothetical protein
LACHSSVLHRLQRKNPRGRFEWPWIDKSQSCPCSGSCKKEEKIVITYYITISLGMPDDFHTLFLRLPPRGAQPFNQLASQRMASLAVISQSLDGRTAWILPVLHNLLMYSCVTDRPYCAARPATSLVV